MLPTAFNPFPASCITPQTGWYSFTLSFHTWVLTGCTENTNVIHQLLREGDPRFRVELLNFSQRDQILQLSNIKDGKILFPPKIRNIAKQIKLDG
ncbi:hypothetical protein YC2023_039806 [Brassica napus]